MDLKAVRMANICCLVNPMLGMVIIGCIQFVVFFNMLSCIIFTYLVNEWKALDTKGLPIELTPEAAFYTAVGTFSVWLLFQTLPILGYWKKKAPLMVIWMISQIIMDIGITIVFIILISSFDNIAQEVPTDALSFSLAMLILVMIFIDYSLFVVYHSVKDINHFNSREGQHILMSSTNTLPH